MGAIAVRRGLPARAVTIAIATAMQESKLYNLEARRPRLAGPLPAAAVAGLGHAARDPRSLLLDQRLLRRARAGRRLRHDGDHRGRAGGAALGLPRGVRRARARRPGAGLGAHRLLAPRPSRARLDGDAEPGPDRLRPSGLTPRADLVRRDLEAAFGAAVARRLRARRRRSGHMEGSTHYDGRAVDVFVRPVSEENNRRGWAIASYLVTQADRLDIQHVIFDGRIWTSGSHSDDGLARLRPALRAGRPRRPRAPRPRARRRLRLSRPPPGLSGRVGAGWCAGAPERCVRGC